MPPNKPVRKSEATRGCETCIFKNGDFENDTVDPKVIRIYCKARHIKVDAIMMSKDCDFYRLSPEFSQPVKENRYGI